MRHNVAVAQLSHLDMTGFLGTLHFRLRSSTFFTLFDIKVTCDGSEIYSTKKEIGHFPPAVFFNANAITFIVVYIFNTGKFEIVSFKFESQFLNVSLFLFSCVFKMLLLDFLLKSSNRSYRILTV